MISDTSKKVYKEIIAEGLIANVDAKVMESIIELEDATAREIGEYVELTPNYITRAITNLYECKLISKIGKRECSISGRTAYSWQAYENPTYQKPDKPNLVCCPMCKGKGKILPGQIKLEDYK